MTFDISKAEEILSAEMPDAANGLKRMKHVREQKCVGNLKNE